ncbi:MAG: hypothetical protein ACTHK0_05925 [Ginsengibacter sp.]
MKQVFAFILLLSHMNTSMFLPQVPEQDVYDAHGNLVDDINSITELVLVSLGIDHTADDEDDDSGQNFQLVRMADCVFHPFFNEINNTGASTNTRILYSDFTNNKISRIAYDLIIPPPKLA